MKDFQCRSCDYKFRSSKLPNVCPYCAKTGVIGPQKTAQDFLEDTFSELNEMDESKKDRRL
jgi:hypothetical protein